MTTICNAVFERGTIFLFVAQVKKTHILAR